MYESFITFTVIGAELFFELNEINVIFLISIKMFIDFYYRPRKFFFVITLMYIKVLTSSFCEMPGGYGRVYNINLNNKEQSMEDLNITNVLQD